MPRPRKLTLNLLTLKVVSESRVTRASSVPILGLSVLDLGPMYATDFRQHHRLMPHLLGAGHNKSVISWLQIFHTYISHKKAHTQKPQFRHVHSYTK